MAIANSLVMVVQLYALAGIVFGVFFVFRGVHRVDAVAREGTIGFRLLILPASAALWPWLLLRWLRSGSGEQT